LAKAKASQVQVRSKYLLSQNDSPIISLCLGLFFLVERAGTIDSEAHMSGSQPALRLAKVSKAYSEPVLLEVDLELRAGEVHALVGENGAGKSTLARIMAGLTAPDAGEMHLDGSSFAPRKKKEAEERGVRIVMQELNLVANLSIAENIFLDRMPHRFGWIEYASLYRQARDVMERMGMADLDPARPVSSLGVGQQQLVEIAAGLSRSCRVLILDEPTAALTDPEIDRLFERVKELTTNGAAVLYISHRMEEIRRIADRITVLRDGKVMATRPAGELSLGEVVRLMVGRDLGEARLARKSKTGSPALRVAGLRRGALVRDVSFELRTGEILGFAGLMGSGRTETMRAIFGADRPETGQVFIGDAPTPAVIRSPRDAVRQGIALLTEDRKAQGLLLPLPVRVNTTLLALRTLSQGGGWIRSRAERAQASEWRERLQIRCASIEQPVGQLSGGNQQKVVLAKWLLKNCEILIFDEPTRGIDVGAKFEVYELLGELTEKGKAIIVVSSDLNELLAIADRIAVMSAGRLAAVFERGQWSQEQIMAAALSGYLKRDHAPGQMALDPVR
jgi:ribose transport system ATP-binding protein